MHFYKYVTAGTAKIVISTKTLRWSSPPTLNDPFDMQFAFQLRLDRATARAMALEKSWQHHYGALLDRPLNKLGRVIRRLRGEFPQLSREEFDQEFGETIDASMDNTERKIVNFNATVQAIFARDKILCLSDEPDNILMWSYYAQNHAGAVLRFTDETPDNPLTQAQRVRYVDKMPSLFDDEMMSDMLAGYSAMGVREIMDHVVYTKSSDWEHESEWRVYSGRGRTDGPHEDIPFNMAEFDGVIFGARMGDTDRLALANLLRSFYPGVELYQAQPKPDEYGLAIEIAEENALVVPTSTKVWLLLRLFLKRVIPTIKSRLRWKQDRTL